MAIFNEFTEARAEDAKTLFLNVTIIAENYPWYLNASFSGKNEKVIYDLQLRHICGAVQKTVKDLPLYVNWEKTREFTRLLGEG